MLDEEANFLLVFGESLDDFEDFEVSDGFDGRFAKLVLPALVFDGLVLLPLFDRLPSLLFEDMWEEIFLSFDLESKKIRKCC